MKYSIFEGNLKRLEKKLKRIQNKCRKYDASFKYEIVGEEFKDVQIGNTEETQTLRFIVVDVEGFAKINNWEFVATIDHRETGNVIRNIIDIEIPERYWTSSPYCEHCNTKRRRKDTYLIHNTETDEFKQVGRSCLRDYTGGYDAELAAAYISLHEYLIESEEANDNYISYGDFIFYYDLDDILKMSKAIVSTLGFIPSSAEYGIPSKQSLIDMHSSCKSNTQIEYLQIQGTFDYYEAFNDDEYLANLKNYYLNSEATSSYMKNMKIIFSSDHCSARDFGYIVSAVYSYDKEIEKAQRKAIKEAAQKAEADASEYVGEIKDKITFEVANGDCVSIIDSPYGESYLYKFIDTEGHVFMWSTSKSLKLDAIESITGTVKDHREYNGIKQTWITRCKVELRKIEEPKDEDDLTAESVLLSIFKDEA